jgi:hypothetical protein
MALAPALARSVRPRQSWRAQHIREFLLAQLSYAQNLRHDIAVAQWFADTRRRLTNGKLDNFALLNKLTARLDESKRLKKHVLPS